MKNSYILFDGAVVSRESWQKDPEDWILQSDQVIRADFFASGNRVPFLQPSLELLSARFSSVGWQLPDSLTLPSLLPRFEKLLNKNRLFKGSLIRLLIMPVLSVDGLAGTIGFRYLAVIEELPHDYFPLNTRGLAIGVSTGFRNTGEPFYSSMVRSRIRSLLIREEYLAQGWDDSILIDQNGYLSESSVSNLFIRFQNRVSSPAIENNRLPRIITHIAQNLIVKSGLQFSEVKTLTLEDLKNAEEVFLTDDMNGIRWVLSFEKKRFYRKLSVSLSEDLQKLMQRTDQFSMGSSG